MFPEPHSLWSHRRRFGANLFSEDQNSEINFSNYPGKFLAKTAQTATGPGKYKKFTFRSNCF